MRAAFHYFADNVFAEDNIEDNSRVKFGVGLLALLKILKILALGKASVFQGLSLQEYYNRVVSDINKL